METKKRKTGDQGATGDHSRAVCTVWTQRAEALGGTIQTGAGLPGGPIRGLGSEDRKAAWKIKQMKT